MRLVSLGWPISRTASALLELGGQGTDTDGSIVRNEAKEIAQSASAQSQSPSLDVIAARFPLPWFHYLQQVVAKTHRDAERCVSASSMHPTGYRLSLRVFLCALSDFRGSTLPVFSMVDPHWSLHPWPPQHKSKPTDSTCRRAPGPGPSRERPAPGYVWGYLAARPKQATRSIDSERE